MRLPILFDMDEVERLHSIAYTAALQTGAKGVELDGVTAEIFRSLAVQANLVEVQSRRKPPLALVRSES